jgi:hypothetical protein
MNNHDPINGLKSVPFSSDADQAMSAMSSSMLPAAAATASNVLYNLLLITTLQMLVRL